MKLNDLSSQTDTGLPPPQPDSEADRERILASYGLDGLEDDPELAAIAGFAAKLCEVPVAMVSLVEEKRQRFLVREGLEARETPRNVSFCAHAMSHDKAMEIPDATADDRFSNNALVTGDPNVRFYAGQPLKSVDDVPLGALCVIDTKPREGLTEFQREGMKVLGEAVMRRLASRRFSISATKKLESSRNQLETVIDSIADIAFSAGADGKFEYFNRRWYEYTGEADDFEFDNTLVNVHSEDRDAALGEWTEALQQASPFETEFRYRRADGVYRWMLVRVLPSIGANGQIERWFGTMTDIHDTYVELESRDLLARELSHRIKNIFAVVSSLISLRARGKPEVKEFAVELTGTIRALGRAHDYVRPLEGRKGDSLHGLLDDLLNPYRNGSDERITVSGDDRPIGPQAATPLALVFHELATNSAKYGALSTDHGTVGIAIQPDVDAERVQIIWCETAGEHRPDENSKGFGSRLVKLSVEGQLGGSLERHFGDDGMRVELTVSTQAIAS